MQHPNRKSDQTEDRCLQDNRIRVNVFEINSLAMSDFDKF